MSHPYSLPSFKSQNTSTSQQCISIFRLLYLTTYPNPITSRVTDERLTERIPAFAANGQKHSGLIEIHVLIPSQSALKSSTIQETPLLIYAGLIYIDLHRTLALLNGYKQRNASDQHNLFFTPLLSFLPLLVLGKKSPSANKLLECYWSGAYNWRKAKHIGRISELITDICNFLARFVKY